MSGFKIGADIGKPDIDVLAAQIKSGAIMFLKTEYFYLTFFVISLAATLFALFALTESVTIATAVSLSFVFGASLSAAAGWWGMMVATDGNAMTTAACSTDKEGNAGLKVAFTTGAVMGFAVVALGLSGVSLTFFILSSSVEGDSVMQCLAGFDFGASSIALFARVAGGIYTK